ncbi:MAG: DUF882 domain-containing protein [Rhizobiaceae bacterium]
MAIAGLLVVTLSAAAQAETRTLKLYYLHTGEKTEVTFKKDGRYLDAGLKKASWALRDWRRNEPTKMDPRLLDIVWEAYQRSGSRDWIHVVSGYRAPATNNMLRQRGRGVAKNSQHTLGRAMDFFLPDVKLAKLREVGLKIGGGGVGFYPTSGSPFVHLDVGNVRHWPRMSRQELVRIFPDGKTLHVPTDGKPLPGYEQALAAYESRKNGKAAVVVASADKKKKRGLFQLFAANTEDDQQDDEGGDNATLPRKVTTTAEPAETGQVQVASVEATAPEASALPTGPVPSAEVELARLDPIRIPVPIAAPRAQFASQQAEVQLASLGSSEPSIPLAGEDTGSLAAAAELENVPVPVKRPAHEIATVLAALSAPVPAADTGAPLTPEEIENLRRTASDVPLQPQTGIVLAMASGSVANGERTAAQAAFDNVIAPTPRPQASGSIPVPDTRPLSGPDQRTLELALVPQDGGNSATQAIRALIEAGDRMATASIPSKPAKRRAPSGQPISRLALAINRNLRSVSELSPPAFGASAFAKIIETRLPSLFVPSGKSMPTGRFVQ